MNKFLYVLSIIVCSFCCQPAFWEVDTTYKLPVNDLLSIQTQEIKLNDIQHSEGVFAKYIISDIKTKVNYDDSKQKQQWNQNSVTISGGVLNFEFQFKAQSKNIINPNKRYLGNVTAKMTNVLINYTKKAILKNGSVSFVIQSLSVENNSVIIPQQYKPIPEDISEFNLLIKNNFTQQLLTFCNTKLGSMLIESINNVSSPFTFNNSSYIYSFKQMNVSINTSVTNFTFGETGYVIGYNGTVGNKKTGCNKFIPKKDEKAFYMSFFTSSDLYDCYYSGYSGWQNMIFNRLNTKSRLFSFNMVDLKSILPSVTEQFPNYLDKVQIQCSLNNSIPRVLGYEDFYATFVTNLNWECSIYRVIDHINLLSIIHIRHRIPMTQINNMIQVMIQSSLLETVSFIPVQKYPLQNQELAKAYLTSIISQIKGSTIGSGFLQPFRNNTSIQILKGQNYVVLKFSQRGQSIE